MRSGARRNATDARSSENQNHGVAQIANAVTVAVPLLAVLFADTLHVPPLPVELSTIMLVLETEKPPPITDFPALQFTDALPV
jgi:hypothetical protein